MNPCGWSARGWRGTAQGLLRVLNSFRWTRLLAPHHHPSLPRDKLVEPACLRITSPRYTGHPLPLFLRLETPAKIGNRPSPLLFSSSSFFCTKGQYLPFLPFSFFFSSLFIFRSINLVLFLKNKFGIREFLKRKRTI